MKAWSTCCVKLPAPLPMVRPSSCFGWVTSAPLASEKIAYGAFW